MATFGEALEAMKRDKVVQMADGSHICLQQFDDQDHDMVSQDVRELLNGAGFTITPMLMKTGGNDKALKFGWIPTIEDLLREDYKILNLPNEEAVAEMP